jgi:hypothetical protein
VGGSTIKSVLLDSFSKIEIYWKSTTLSLALRAGWMSSKTSSCSIVIAMMPNLLKMANRGVDDKHQDIEEPDEGKAFMSGFGDQQVERSAC